MTRNYGTNNPEAWSDSCFNAQEHIWKETHDDGRGRKRYVCQACRSQTVVDSGD